MFRGSSVIALLGSAAFFGSTLERIPLSVNAWSTHGPVSGGVSALALDPDNPSTLYATTPLQGLLKSEDDGETWRRINRPGSAAIFGPFALSPSRSRTLYAFEANDLYRSDDGGNSWVYRGRVPDAGNVGLVVVDPIDPATLYAAASQFLSHGFQRLGLYKSHDGGQSWTLLPLGGMGISRLVVNPSNQSVLYAAIGTFALARSLDGGTTWSFIPTPVGNGLDFAVDPMDPNTLYAIFSPAGIFRSHDGGSSWTPINNPISTSLNLLSRLAVDPVRSQTIYAGTQSSLFRSDDAGATWTFLTSDVQNILAIDPIHSSTLYGAPLFGWGGAKSVDGGRTWITLQTGEIATWISALAASPGGSTIIHAVGFGASNLEASYRSDDSGFTWTASRSGLTKNPGAGLSCIVVDPTDPNVLFAGRSGYSQAVSPGLFKSLTGGLAWFAFGGGLPDFGVVALIIDPRNAQTLYAGTFYGVYRSDDGGATWRPRNAGQLDSIVALAMDTADSARLYAAGTHDFFRSVDGGASWTATRLVITSPVGTASYNVGAIAVDPMRRSTLYIATSRGLLGSTDGAMSWSPVGVGFFGDPLGQAPDLTAVTTDPLRPGHIYVGSRQGRVFRSADGGESWEPFDRGLPPVQINTLEFERTGAVLYAATAGRGVYNLHVLSSRPAVRTLRPR